MTDAQSAVREKIESQKRWMEAHPDCFTDQNDDDLFFPTDFPARLRENDLLCGLQALEINAFLWGYQGTRWVLEKNPDGWKRLAASLAYSTWAALLDAKFFFTPLPDSRRRRNQTLRDPSITASLLCHALLTNNKHICLELSAILLKAIATPGAVSEDCRLTGLHLECFSLRLCNSFLPLNLPDALLHRDLGIYQAALDAHDQPSLTSAAINLCDHHVLNMSDTRNQPPAKFSTPPFDLLPLEIAALLKQKTLPLHLDPPLMTTGLEQMTFPPFPENKTLAQARALYEAAPA
jgi:hypothetical protein